VEGKIMKPRSYTKRQSLDPDKYKSDLKVFHGIIAPEKWGGKDQLKKIALHTFDEGKLLILENYFFEELKESLYESVEIRGRVDTDENGFDTIYTVGWRLSGKPEKEEKVKRNENTIF